MPTPPIPKAVSRSGLVARALGIGLVLSGLVPPAGGAQVGEELRFRYLTIAEGLSQNAVLAILQDRDGFMWFGTKDGLNRYDGQGFRIYRHDPFSPTSLSDNEVTALFEDRDGHLWVGTDAGGLDRFDRDQETFHHYPLGADSPVSGITQGPGGELWVATNGDGLARIFPGPPGEGTTTVDWFRHDPDIPSSLGYDFVNALLMDREGTLWVGHGRGLDRLDPGAAGFVGYPVDPESPTGLMDDRGVSALLEDGEGRIWMGFASGLGVLDGERSRMTRHYHRYRTERFGWGQVKAILEDREGVLWLATAGELMRFHPSAGSFEYLPHDPALEEGMNSDLPTALFQDRSEVVWVGTNGYGLNIHDPKARRFGTFTRPDTRRWRVAEFSVYTLFEDAAEEAVWIGAGLLYRWDRSSGEFTSFETSVNRPDDFGNTGVWDIIEHPRGFLWAATYQGLYHYEIATGRVRHYRHDPDDPESLPETSVHGILREPSGRLWVVGPNHLAELVDPEAGRFRSHRYADRPSGSWTFPSMVRTPDGILWFGSEQGLMRFDPADRSFRRYRNDPADSSSLGHDVVRAVLADPGDPGATLWVGTVGGGLNRLDLRTGRFTHYTTEDGLPNNAVYAILPDEEGRLWLSTNRGLSRLDPATGTFRNFDAGDGLQSDEFNSSAAFRSRDGEMFFGGIHGFNHFHPAEIRDNPHVPNVVITGFRRLNRPEHVGDSGSVLERSIVETRELRLTHEDNVITFEYAALDFSNPSKNRYAYRMLGFTDEWIDAGTERGATFTNLPPGSYTFQVRGSNNDGVWNEAGASLALVVLPPWWRTRGALVLYGLLVGGLLLGLRRYETNRLRLKHRAEREHEVAEQLRELDRTRSRFFANVSHEFRTPLTLTLGPLDDLRSGFHGPLPAPVQAQVELARRNAGRVLELIDQLLQVARLEAGSTPLHARPLDLDALVRRVGAEFVPLAGRQEVELRMETPEAPIELVADPAHLEKILANLLSNALKFTSEGGRVTLRLESDDEKARITVDDTGRGIPASELPRIFDRFYRGKHPLEEATPGTGIGLALVRELVHLHGGTVEVESEPGAGSRFAVVLRRGREHLLEHQIPEDPYPDLTLSPLAPPPRTGEEDGGPAEVHGGAEGEVEDVTTVLVAEDNPELRGYIRSHLERRFRVLEAGDGEEALAMARRSLPDLVISDVMMPSMDGYELCRRLKEDADTDFIPVVLLTARASAEDRLTGLQGRADSYLTKPFDMEELHTVVRNHLEVRERLETRLAALSGAGRGGDGSGPTHHEPPRAEPVDVESPDALFLEQVRATIEEHMENEDFRVDELARRVAHSRSHLHRRLKELIDESPSDLIRRMRLERAASLLEARAGSVSRIAYAVGFKSLSHFSNRFSDHFGVRPSRYPPEEDGRR